MKKILDTFSVSQIPLNKNNREIPVDVFIISDEVKLKDQHFKTNKIYFIKIPRFIYHSTGCNNITVSSDLLNNIYDESIIHTIIAFIARIINDKILIMKGSENKLIYKSIWNFNPDNNLDNMDKDYFIDKEFTDDFHHNMDIIEDNIRKQKSVYKNFKTVIIHDSIIREVFCSNEFDDMLLCEFVDRLFKIQKTYNILIIIPYKDNNKPVLDMISKIFIKVIK